MKKINKKGFTLVELLAVVVILLAISVVAVASISAAIERNKEKQNQSKIEILISYAKLYYEENKNSLSSTDGIVLSTLEDAGYITNEEYKDVDGNYFEGVICYTNGANFTYNSNGYC